MNQLLIRLIIKRLYSLVLGQHVEKNIIGTMNSLITKPISLDMWNMIYDRLLQNQDFINHENGKRFLRWKPSNIEEYHYRIIQCTHYFWILDQENVSHYRDETIDVFFE